MPDYLPIDRFPLPDNLEPAGTICVKVTIPDDMQYLGTLIGLIDLLKWSRNFARDETGIGAATVSRTWQAALESEPIKVQGCDMPDFRINHETCLLEVDCSGDGTDWQPVYTPSYDPSQDEPLPEPPYPDPPPTGQSNECLAAANAAAFLQNGSGQFATLLGANNAIGQIIAMLYSFLSAVISVTLSQLWLGIGPLFESFNALTIEDDYAAFDWDDVKNILACHYESDGTMTFFHWEEVLSEFQTLASGTGNQIWLLVAMVWALMGTVGAAYAGRWGGIDSADCEICADWIHTDDMTAGMHGWDFVPFPPTDLYDPDEIRGVFESGKGARTTISETYPAGGYRLLMAQDIDPTVIQTIRVISGFSTGNNTTEVYRLFEGVRTQINGSVQRDPMEDTGCGDYDVGADVTFDCEGLVFDGVEIYISAGASDSWICTVQIAGQGTDPFAA